MQYTQENLENLSRKEIQSIAKDVGLKCNGKSVDLIKGILESQAAAQVEAVEPPPVIQSASETNPAGKLDQTTYNHRSCCYSCSLFIFLFIKSPTMP